MGNIIELKKRENFGKVGARRLRGELLVPGVVYGDQIPSRHFSIENRKIVSLKKAAEKTGLFDIQIEGDDAPVKAIIQKIQKDPVTEKCLHIDLYQVRMDRKLHTEIEILLTGESSAVENLGGVLVKQHDKLPIECLPGDLIHNIEVPIDGLVNFGDVIRVKDLNLPKEIHTHLEEDEIIVSVTEPRSEKELADLEGEVKAEVENIEVTTEKKEEGKEDTAEEQKE